MASNNLPEFCVCAKCKKAAKKPLTLACCHTLCADCYRARGECEVNIQSLEGTIMAAETAVATVLSRRKECIEEMKEHLSLVNTMMDSAREELRKLEESMRQSWDQNADLSRDHLRHLNKSKEQNKKGVRIADRCLSHAPNEEVEGLLSEVLNHQTTPTQNLPILTSVVFSGPDKTEMQRLMGKIVGTLTTESLSVLHPKVCHTTFSRDTCPQETIRVKFGSSMCLLEVGGIGGLHQIIGSDEQRKTYGREQVKYTSVCVSKDGKCVYCCFHDNVFHTYTCEDDGSLQFQNEQRVEGTNSLDGICVISDDDRLVAVDYEYDAIFVLSRCGRVLQSLGLHNREVKGTKCIGSPRYVTSSSDGKLIYISNEGYQGVPASVTCIDITNESVKWLTELKDPRNIYRIGRYLYITHETKRQVTVLDLEDGSEVKVIECPGKARCVFADSYDKVTIVSYRTIG